MENSISLDIVIYVPPEEVFRAWTDPAEFVAWWGDDEKYRTTGMECDLRPGGAWKSVGVTKEGQEFNVHGEYLRVDRPTELSFTWKPSWEQGEPTIVNLQFIPVEGGTRLVVHHTGFKADDARTGHYEGWTQVLDWLKRYKESK